MQPLSKPTTWLRTAKFRYALYVHRREAAAHLRSLHARGVPPLSAAARRDVRAYAHDALGSRAYVPWLDTYATLRGSFREGWIPVDFFNLIVERHVNGYLRRMGSAKSFLARIVRSPSIPDVGYIIGGVYHGLDWQPLDPPRVVAALFAETDEIIVKDDGGSGGKQVAIERRASFEPLRVAQRSPDAVLQRRLVDHPQLRMHEGGNGTRMRLTTCMERNGTATVRAAFVSFPGPGQPITPSPGTVVVAVHPADGTYGAAFGPAGFEVPQAAPFHGRKVVAFEAARDLCTSLHARLPQLGVIGWDVMIDANERPWIIEWNTQSPGIKWSEALVGPNFVGLGWHAMRWRPSLL